ncbi:hypothetical protein BD769DRAFT_1684593 [Suillus cothurnatus]|nr:hypothetical protein BD769DRAFT_1684593 [Suillus cothurnatus]
MSTWVGPEGKATKSTNMQSSLYHPRQEDSFNEDQMMVSPVLGPAMPFHDAPDEDLEMLENRATQSSSFGMVMSTAEVQSSLQPAAGNAQPDAANKRSPAYSASKADIEVPRLTHHKYLKKLNLVINAELNILCCEFCQVAILPNEAKTHVKTKHSQTEFDDVKFAQVMKEEGILSDLPRISGARSQVEGLAVHDALGCGHCNRVFISIKHAREHYSEAHKGTAKPQEWRACKAQHFRNGGPGTHQIYWEVENYAAPEACVKETLMRAIMKDMESVLQVVEAPQDKRTVSPWLLTTRWHEHLAGNKPTDLMDLVAIPKRNDELMPLLKEHVEAYFESTLALLSTTDELTLQRLNSPDPMKE